MSSKSEYKRLWYLRNSETEKSKAKEYREENPTYKSSWLKENGNKPKVRFDKARSNTVTKTKKEWLLTFEEYEKLIVNPCYYCEKDISNERGSGLDRLDNKVGYRLGNVVACCKACNVGKNEHFTPEEWKIMINALLASREIADD
jgi:hypothetical protein